MLALLALLFPSALSAQTLVPNSASVSLDGKMSMTLAAEQPGGSCWPGYAWHAVHGGCRRRQQETQTQRLACPPGQLGDQIRSDTRYTYLLQGGSHIAHDAWAVGPWDTSACQPALPDWPALERRIPESLQVDYAIGTSFGAAMHYGAHLMLHKATGRLWCYASITATEAQTHPILSEYPASGQMYADVTQQHLLTQCQPQETSVLLSGANTGAVTVRLLAIENQGCIYRFSRELHASAISPTPFEPLINIC